jgi:hypothetical protein
MKTIDKIKEILDGMFLLLEYKNRNYGNAALEPLGIFHKGGNENSIKIRIDDKLSRIKNSNELRVNDIVDLLGYLILLLVSMDVNKNDIEKLKD